MAGTAAARRMHQKLLSNGCVTYHNYDAAGRLTSLLNVDPDLAPLPTFEYTYDDNSNIIQIARESGNVQYFAYDSLGRLTACDWRDSNLDPVRSFEYEYDGVGNRLRLTRETGDTYYTYDAADRLLTVKDDAGTREYEFDANGNQTKITDGADETDFHWTAMNMLSQIDFPDSSHNYFTYDGGLRRIRKHDSSGTIQYTWDGLDVIQERNAAGDTTAQYLHGHTPIHGIASLIAKSAGGSEEYCHLNHIGSTHAMTDSAGALTQTYDYSPFGVILDGPPDPNGQYLFSSKPWDADADLYHFVARQMDPARGAFLSRDPIGRGTFAYAGGSPFGFVDPNGECLTPIEWAVIIGPAADCAAGYFGGGDPAYPPGLAGLICGLLADLNPDLRDDIEDAVADWFRDLTWNTDVGDDFRHEAREEGTWCGECHPSVDAERQATEDRADNSIGDTIEVVEDVNDAASDVVESLIDEAAEQAWGDYMDEWENWDQNEPREGWRR